LFDAPLSASVVTKEDIRKSGCTSVMEALRLVPGMIVREQSNGNYDIYLRGMDNVPPNGPFEGNSTTTLVMIDNRPIYNYLKGGTFWETLPVDINDVDRIEIVRGPAAALYGPNAVSGVINIITRQTKKDGLYLLANTQQGSYHTFINNVSIGYQSNKFSIIASGNYQGRERSQTSYFELYRNRLVDHPAYLIGLLGDTAFNIDESYPKQQSAMEKYAGNVFLNYHPANKIKFDLSAGAQHSIVQKVSTENGTMPLSTVGSDSKYVDFRAGMKGLSAQLSYNHGTQAPDFNPGNMYDFSTFDANVEYNYNAGNLSIKPGLSYRNAVYDDTRHADIASKTGIFNGKARITTQSALLRGEYKMFNNKLRLVAGLTASTFNYPDTTYCSYELAATYKLNKKHLFRIVYSRSPRSSTIYDTHLNQQANYFPIGYHKFISIQLEGNKNLRLLTANMLEIGYRGNITPGMHIDVELFDIRSKNYNSLASHAPYIKFNGADTIMVVPLIPTNLPVELTQQGITISLTCSSKKLQVKPFITFQHSTIKNYAPFANTPDATITATGAINAAQNNIYSGIGTSSTGKATPAVFGGASVNYALTSKININMSAYYYSKQTYTHVSNVVFNDGMRGIDHINAKLIINASISYEPSKKVSLFCSGKNILNDKSREFFHSDEVPFMLLAGLRYEF
jgi:iron complex outermembrane receptor protein